MPESRRDRWLSIGMSVLLHGTLIGLLAYGWWRWHHSAPAPHVSIDATVLDAHTLKGVGLASKPAPHPKPSSQPKPKPKPASPQPSPSQGPPLPSSQQLAQRAKLEKAETQRQAKAEQELKQRQQAEQAHRKAEAKAKAKAKKLAEARKRAEAKKRAEERKLAEQRKLAAERRAAREKAARQAALAQMQRNIRQEEQSDAAARAGLASWTQQIEGRIADAWIRPPTAKPGIDCVLNVSQVKGGAVTNVSIGRCNGDQAVRESIEAAVYRASPLPPPPDPSLFQRQLIIEFKPN